MLLRLFIISLSLSTLFGQALASDARTDSGSEALVWQRPQSTEETKSDTLPLLVTGLGVASFGVGLTLLLVSRAEYDELGDPIRDSDDRIRGVTQREVSRQEAQLADRSTAGVVLMSVGALSALGGILWNMTNKTDSSAASPFGTSPIQPYGSIGNQLDQASSFGLRFDADF